MKKNERMVRRYMYLFFVFLITECLTTGILLSYILDKRLKAVVALCLLLLNVLIVRCFFKKIIPRVYEKYKETDG